MTERTGVVDTVSPAPSPPSSRGRIVLGVFGVVAVITAAWAFHWWTHPTVISENQMGLGSGATAPTPLAEAVFHVGVAGTPWREPYGAPADEEWLTLHSATAHLDEDGAGLRTSFLVCTAAQSDSAIGVVQGEDLSEHCSDVREIRDGTRIRWGSREYLVLTLRATRPGISHVDSVDIDYSRSGDHLFQHGTERLDGGEITVRVTD